MPDPTDYPAKRLFSLDLLRGLDIFLLTLLGHFVKYGLFKSFTPSPGVDLFWKHSLTSFAGQGVAPTGWGIWDFGQPLFIFICGAAVPFAIPKRLDVEGRPTVAFWKHVLGRVAMLWIIGMVLRDLLTFDPMKFKPYGDTLQTIAVAYLAAALSMLITWKWVRFAIAIGLIAVFGVIQATCGDYTQFGNISRIIDTKLFGALGLCSKDFCYILTTLPWAAMGILGSLVAEVLKSPRTNWGKAKLLAVWGVASCALGLVLGLWIPPIRYIYTVSFIFQTLGLAILLLDALFIVTDIWQLRKGMGYFLMLGQCSLACWLLSTFFAQSLGVIVDKLIVGLPRLAVPTYLMPVIHWSVRVVVFSWLISLYWKYRHGNRTR